VNDVEKANDAAEEQQKIDEGKEFRSNKNRK